MKKPMFIMLKCACGKNFKHPTGVPGRRPSKCPKCRANKEK